MRSSSGTSTASWSRDRERYRLGMVATYPCRRRLTRLVSRHMSSPALAPLRRHLGPRQADTVDRLVDAAVTLVARTGYDGLTVRGVAQEAGVAPATAYTYFASKEHLLAEVYW